jgi:hypothetical protein
VLDVLELLELDEELAEDELDELEELLDDELEEELDEEEEELELLDEDVVVPAYEHQAEVVKLLVGKLLDRHATLVVKVPYTKLPALPSATERVPLNEHVAPVFCAHLV